MMKNLFGMMKNLFCNCELRTKLFDVVVAMMIRVFFFFFFFGKRENEDLDMQFGLLRFRES